LLIASRIYGDRIIGRGIHLFVDVIDGLELIVYSIAGILAFACLNLWLWRWVDSQASALTTIAYLVTIVSLLTAVLADIHRRKPGYISMGLIAVYVGCVIWAAFGF
jgi:hypothetical protein